MAGLAPADGERSPRLFAESASILTGSHSATAFPGLGAIPEGEFSPELSGDGEQGPVRVVRHESGVYSTREGDQLRRPDLNASWASDEGEAAPLVSTGLLRPPRFGSVQGTPEFGPLGSVGRVGRSGRIGGSGAQALAPQTPQPPVALPVRPGKGFGVALDAPRGEGRVDNRDNLASLDTLDTITNLDNLDSLGIPVRLLDSPSAGALLKPAAGDPQPSPPPGAAPPSQKLRIATSFGNENSRCADDSHLYKDDAIQLLTATAKNALSKVSQVEMEQLATSAQATIDPTAMTSTYLDNLSEESLAVLEAIFISPAQHLGLQVAGAPGAAGFAGSGLDAVGSMAATMSSRGRPPAPPSAGGPRRLRPLSRAGVGRAANTPTPGAPLGRATASFVRAISTRLTLEAVSGVKANRQSAYGQSLAGDTHEALLGKAMMDLRKRGPVVDPSAMECNRDRSLDYPSFVAGMQTAISLPPYYATEIFHTLHKGSLNRNHYMYSALVRSFTDLRSKLRTSFPFESISAIYAGCRVYWIDFLNYLSAKCMGQLEQQANIRLVRLKTPDTFCHRGVIDTAIYVSGLDVYLTSGRDGLCQVWMPPHFNLEYGLASAALGAAQQTPATRDGAERFMQKWGQRVATEGAGNDGTAGQDSTAQGPSASGQATTEHGSPVRNISAYVGVDRQDRDDHPFGMDREYFDDMLKAMTAGTLTEEPGKLVPASGPLTASQAGPGGVPVPGAECTEYRAKLAVETLTAILLKFEKRKILDIARASAKFSDRSEQREILRDFALIRTITDPYTDKTVFPLPNDNPLPRSIQQDREQRSECYKESYSYAIVMAAREIDAPLMSSRPKGNRIVQRLGSGLNVRYQPDFVKEVVAEDEARQKAEMEIQERCRLARERYRPAQISMGHSSITARVREELGLARPGAGAGEVGPGGRSVFVYGRSKSTGSFQASRPRTGAEAAGDVRGNTRGDATARTEGAGSRCGGIFPSLPSSRAGSAVGQRSRSAPFNGPGGRPLTSRAGNTSRLGGALRPPLPGLPGTPGQQAPKYSSVEHPLVALKARYAKSGADRAENLDEQVERLVQQSVEAGHRAGHRDGPSRGWLASSSAAARPQNPLYAQVDHYLAVSAYDVKIRTLKQQERRKEASGASSAWASSAVYDSGLGALLLTTTMGSLLVYDLEKDFDLRRKLVLSDTGISSVEIVHRAISRLDVGQLKNVLTLLFYELPAACKSLLLRKFSLDDCAWYFDSISQDAVIRTYEDRYYNYNTSLPPVEQFFFAPDAEEEGKYGTRVCRYQIAGIDNLLGCTVPGYFSKRIVPREGGKPLTTKLYALSGSDFVLFLLSGAKETAEGTPPEAAQQGRVGSRGDVAEGAGNGMAGSATESGIQMSARELRQTLAETGLALSAGGLSLSTEIPDLEYKSLYEYDNFGRNGRRCFWKVDVTQFYRYYSLELLVRYLVSRSHEIRSRLAAPGILDEAPEDTDLYAYLAVDLLSPDPSLPREHICNSHLNSGNSTDNIVASLFAEIRDSRGVRIDSSGKRNRFIKNTPAVAVIDRIQQGSSREMLYSRSTIYGASSPSMATSATSSVQRGWKGPHALDRAGGSSAGYRDGEGVFSGASGSCDGLSEEDSTEEPSGFREDALEGDSGSTAMRSSHRGILWITCAHRWFSRHDGKDVYVTGLSNGDILVWNLVTLRPRHVISAFPKSDVTALAYDPDDNILYAASFTGDVRIYNYDISSTPIADFKENGAILDIFFSPSCDSIITVLLSGDVTVWSNKFYQPLFRMSTHMSPTRSFWDEANSVLVLCDREMRAFKLAGSELIKEQKMHERAHEDSLRVRTVQRVSALSVDQEQRGVSSQKKTESRPDVVLSSDAGLSAVTALAAAAAPGLAAESPEVVGMGPGEAAGAVGAKDQGSAVGQADPAHRASQANQIGGAAPNSADAGAIGATGAANTAIVPLAAGDLPRSHWTRVVAVLDFTYYQNYASSTDEILQLDLSSGLGEDFMVVGVGTDSGPSGQSGSAASSVERRGSFRSQPGEFPPPASSSAGSGASNSAGKAAENPGMFDFSCAKAFEMLLQGKPGKTGADSSGAPGQRRSASAAGRLVSGSESGPEAPAGQAGLVGLRAAGSQGGSGRSRSGFSRPATGRCESDSQDGAGERRNVPVHQYRAPPFRPRSLRENGADSAETMQQINAGLHQRRCVSRQRFLAAMGRGGASYSNLNFGAYEARANLENAFSRNGPASLDHAGSVCNSARSMSADVMSSRTPRSGLIAVTPVLADSALGTPIVLRESEEAASNWAPPADPRAARPASAGASGATLFSSIQKRLPSSNLQRLAFRGSDRDSDDDSSLSRPTGMLESPVVSRSRQGLQRSGSESAMFGSVASVASVSASAGVGAGAGSATPATPAPLASLAAPTPAPASALALASRSSLQNARSSPAGDLARGASSADDSSESSRSGEAPAGDAPERVSLDDGLVRPQFIASGSGESQTSMDLPVADDDRGASFPLELIGEARGGPADASALPDPSRGQRGGFARPESAGSAAQSSSAGPVSRVSAAGNVDQANQVHHANSTKSPDSSEAAMDLIAPVARPKSAPLGQLKLLQPLRLELIDSSDEEDSSDSAQDLRGGGNARSGAGERESRSSTASRAATVPALPLPLISRPGSAGREILAGRAPSRGNSFSGLAGAPCSSARQGVLRLLDRGGTPRQGSVSPQKLLRRNTSFNTVVPSRPKSAAVSRSRQAGAKRATGIDIMAALGQAAEIKARLFDDILPESLRAGATDGGGSEDSGESDDAGVSRGFLGVKNAMAPPRAQSAAPRREIVKTMTAESFLEDEADVDRFIAENSIERCSQFKSRICTLDADGNVCLWLILQELESASVSQAAKAAAPSFLASKLGRGAATPLGPSQSFAGSFATTPSGKRGGVNSLHRSRLGPTTPLARVSQPSGKEPSRRRERIVERALFLTGFHIDLPAGVSVTVASFDHKSNSIICGLSNGEGLMYSVDLSEASAPYNVANCARVARLIRLHQAGATDLSSAQGYSSVQAAAFYVTQFMGSDISDTLFACGDSVLCFNSQFAEKLSHNFVRQLLIQEGLLGESTDLLDDPGRGIPSAGSVVRSGSSAPGKGKAVARGADVQMDGLNTPPRILLTGHSGNVISLDVHRARNMILSADDEGKVIFWSSLGIYRSVVEFPRERPVCVKFSEAELLPGLAFALLEDGSFWAVSGAEKYRLFSIQLPANTYGKLRMRFCTLPVRVVGESSEGKDGRQSSAAKAGTGAGAGSGRKQALLAVSINSIVLVLRVYLSSGQGMRKEASKSRLPVKEAVAAEAAAPAGPPVAAGSAAPASASIASQPKLPPRPPSQVGPSRKAPSGVSKPPRPSTAGGAPQREGQDSAEGSAAQQAARSTDHDSSSSSASLASDTKHPSSAGSASSQAANSVSPDFQRLAVSPVVAYLLPCSCCSVESLTFSHCNLGLVAGGSAGHVLYLPVRQDLSVYQNLYSYDRRSRCFKYTLDKTLCELRAQAELDPLKRLPDPIKEIRTVSGKFAVPMSMQRDYSRDGGVQNGFTKRLFDKLDEIAAGVSRVFAYEANDDIHDMVRPTTATQFKVSQAILKQDTLKMYSLEDPTIVYRA